MASSSDLTSPYTLTRWIVLQKARRHPAPLKSSIRSNLVSSSEQSWLVHKLSTASHGPSLAYVMNRLHSRQPSMAHISWYKYPYRNYAPRDVVLSHWSDRSKFDLIPDHFAKRTRRTSVYIVPLDFKGAGLRLLVGTKFQVLFHSPPGVLFTFPSPY